MKSTIREKRETPRAEIANGAAVRFREENSRRTHTGRVMDIGQGGIKVASNIYMRRNRHYIFELLLPFMSAPAMARAELRWQTAGGGKDGACLCGLRFLSPLPKRHKADVEQYVGIRTEGSRAM